MSSVTIQASVRQTGSKGALKSLRQQGFVPGIVYGGSANLRVPIQISERQLAAALSRNSGSAFFTLQLDDGSRHLVLPREIQYDKIKRDLRHIDLLVVEQDEEVRATVPVRIVGTSGAPLQYGLLEIELKAKPAQMPASVDVDVSELEVGQIITVGDLNIPSGVEVISSPEEMVVGVVASVQDPSPEEAEEKSEAAEEPAGEPEA